MYNVRHFLPPAIHHLFLPGEDVVVLALPGVVLVVALLAGAGPPVANLLRLVVAGLVVTVGPWKYFRSEPRFRQTGGDLKLVSIVTQCGGGGGEKGEAMRGRRGGRWGDAEE